MKTLFSGGCRSRHGRRCAEWFDAATAQEDVADYAIAAIAVVEVDCTGVAAGIADIAEVVVSDDIPAAGRVAALVDGAASSASVTTLRMILYSTILSFPAIRTAWCGAL